MSAPYCNRCQSAMAPAFGVAGYAIWRCACGREIPREQLYTAAPEYSWGFEDAALAAITTVMATEDDELVRDVVIAIAASAIGQSTGTNKRDVELLEAIDAVYAMGPTPWEVLRAHSA